VLLVVLASAVGLDQGGPPKLVDAGLAIAPSDFSQDRGGAPRPCLPELDWRSIGALASVYYPPAPSAPTSFAELRLTATARQQDAQDAIGSHGRSDRITVPQMPAHQQIARSAQRRISRFAGEFEGA